MALESGLEGVAASTSSDNTSMALMNDGTIRAWGRNDCGKLGNEGKGCYDYAEYSFGNANGLTPISSYCTAVCTKDRKFNPVLKIKNINDFTKRSFTITYNTNEISAGSDLSKFTFVHMIGWGGLV
ncbi:RCC1 domain-containing protein [Ruminiclostridium papyrosolvens]|uniref:Uncharacterized protein n=1 Tax=Ruminiclostridium papyrosolvens C7 TaxID=1330534 RepID=U4R227_9FIRM|nr:RCC1 domain-containing protein [Ruminiclostridium papyrosolvens]EPR11515.1 hypothetical protein L323_11680 [Ruminiclostridium papyrosolvens C7]